MVLPGANTEEQILYLLPVVITDPSCTSWSWKSFGGNYTVLGLKKVREGDPELCGTSKWVWFSAGAETGEMQPTQDKKM